MLKQRNILRILALAAVLGGSTVADCQQSIGKTPFYWKINLEYDEVVSLNGSFFAVRNGDKYGVVTENKVVLPCKYEAIDALGDDMISFVDKGLIGFADTLGNVRIEPKYAVKNESEIVDNFQLNTFYNGSCVVYDNQSKTYSLINTQGERLLGDSVSLMCRMGDAVVIKQGNVFGMTDSKGIVTYQPKNIKIEMVTPLLFCFTTRQLNGDLLYGLLNAKGEMVSEARFVDFQTYSKNNILYLKAYLKNGLQALFDYDGKMIVDALYQVAEPTVLTDYFKVTQDSYSGMIAKKDSMYLLHLQPIFNDVRIITTKDTFLVAKNGSITSVVYLNGKTLYEGQVNLIDVVPTSAGYRLIVENNFNYGVIDPTGQTIVETKYHEVYSVIDSWILVRMKDKWGAVNMVTKEEIEPVFEKVKIADNRSYAVFVGNKKKSLLLKVEGQMVDFPSCSDVLAMNDYIEYKVKKKKERLYLNGQKIPPMFSVIASAHYGLLPVQDAKGWTFVDDKTYEYKTDKHYSYATSFFDGIAIVVTDMKIAVIDTAFNDLGTILEAKDKVPSLLFSPVIGIVLSYYADKDYVIIRNSGKQGVLGIKKK
ncbi:MAG: WG repeat-containing protein [Bacteroidales bacterium]|nr:WG repeat-containing protein [Bacteroidales bacterium]